MLPARLFSGLMLRQQVHRKAGCHEEAADLHAVTSQPSAPYTGSLAFWWRRECLSPCAISTMSAPDASNCACLAHSR